MASANPETHFRERAAARKKARKRFPPERSTLSSPASLIAAGFFFIAIAFCVYWVFQIHARYTFSLQLPVRVRLHWPVVMARRIDSEDAKLAQLDQRRPLTAYQQYACLKFGPACRVALAIQRAENPEGKCETYHYNSDGTLDWGYFQINTVHLKRPGLNLRDLLDCRANIDFAYQLYSERESFSAWSTYNNGLYRKYLRH